jgi:hypothetical protein
MSGKEKNVQDPNARMVQKGRTDYVNKEQHHLD